MLSIKENFDLSRHNTFGLKARCRRFIEFTELDDLSKLLENLDHVDKLDNVDNVDNLEKVEKNSPLLILGGGSNIVFSKDFPGTIIRSAIQGITVEKENEDSVYVRVGSGVVLDDFVAYCVEHDYYGIENLSLIPGDIGAAAVQNVGAYGVEAKDVIHEVHAYDITKKQFVVFKNEDCHYAYRHSVFKETGNSLNPCEKIYVIHHVVFCLSKTFSPKLEYGNLSSLFTEEQRKELTARQLREAIIAIRNAKLPDPKEIGSAGSFFMNPVVSPKEFERLAKEYPTMPHYPAPDGKIKLSAGWMIDQCGWKGKALGRAGVYEKQALVLVNLGGATGEEIINLCKAVQQSVQEKFGIRLHPEAIII